MLYSSLMPLDKKDDRLRKPMTEVLEMVTRKALEPHVTQLVFEVWCKNAAGEDVEECYKCDGVKGKDLPCAGDG